MAENQEKDRLAALRAYDVLETPSEPSFDRLTRAAARLFGTPFAVVSLVDEERQVFKSSHGLAVTEIPRAISFCAHTIQSDAVFVVPDTSLDTRFSENPLVTGAPRIRFYMGAPLITSTGFRLGALCVLDAIPRPVPAEQDLKILRDLAAEVIERIEERLTHRHLRKTAELLRKREAEFVEQQKVWRKSEAKIAMAVEAGDLGFWEWDAASDQAWWSPRIEQMFGIEPGSGGGSLAAWLQYVHIDDREKAEAEVQRMRKEESSFTFKYRIKRPDGEIRWIVEKGCYQRDEMGGLVSAFGIGWDATERERRDAELRASEELFRGLSASCPAGIYRTDLTAALTYANPRATEIWEMPLEEGLGLGWLARIHPDDRDAVISRWLEANSTCSSFDMEFRLLRPDGGVRWIHGRSAIVFDRDGAPLGTVGTVDDITARKLSDLALREAKLEAEAASRAKDLFLANVSHELRTPLNGILGMSELLLQSPLAIDQRECAEMVRVSGETLLALVNDILDISRIEAGTLQIDVAPFDLRAAVDQASALVRRPLSAKGLRFSIDYPAELPSRFRGDSNRIQQILLNFLTNAIKFTESGGISCQVRMTEDGDASRGLTLAVRDSGCGISEADQGRLFKPFSQVDSSVTRKNGGVGLGLAISRRLAEMMGGGVGVSSAQNAGSTFWLKLELPLAAVAEDVDMAANANGCASAASANRERVLVAEDNPVNQRVVTRMLHKLGWQSDVAPDGEAAAHLATQNRYALVLMDCQMPKADGYAATARIREYETRRGCGHLPIVALTANAMPGDREKCLAAGMDDYLAKPLRLDQLRGILSRWSNHSAGDLERIEQALPA